MNTTKLETLVGEVLTYIDVDPEKNEILLTTASGMQVRIYHEQACCESVKIQDTEGEWHELIGKPIREVIKDEDQKDRGDEGSTTLTTLTFRVDGATVINRWIGESNGCYSESVDIKDIVAPANRPACDRPTAQ